MIDYGMGVRGGALARSDCFLDPSVHLMTSFSVLAFPNLVVHVFTILSARFS